MDICISSDWVVSALHDGFAIDVFDAPADLVGPGICIQRKGPVVTLLEYDSFNAFVVVGKVILQTV